MYPIYNEKVDLEALSNSNNTYKNPKYPSYVICGATGNDEEMETEKCKYFLIVDKPQFYSKLVVNNLGVCHIEITENLLQLKFILSLNNTVFDKFNIIKDS